MVPKAAAMNRPTLAVSLSTSVETDSDSDQQRAPYVDGNILHFQTSPVVSHPGHFFVRCWEVVNERKNRENKHCPLYLRTVRPMTSLPYREQAKRPTCSLWIHGVGLVLSEEVPQVCWRSTRFCCWSMMDLELLLSRHRVLGAAQWEHQEETESCQACHVVPPLLQPLNTNKKQVPNITVCTCIWTGAVKRSSVVYLYLFILVSLSLSSPSFHVLSSLLSP